MVGATSSKDSVVRFSWRQNLYSVGVVVETQNAGAGDSFRLDHRLEVGDEPHVLRHVCREHLQRASRVQTSRNYANASRRIAAKFVDFRAAPSV